MHRAKALYLLLVAGGLPMLTACNRNCDRPLDGPYLLLCTDTSSDRTLVFDLGSGNHIGRVPPTIIAAGWNETYVAAMRKQENGTQAVYVIDRRKDGPFVEPASVTSGPFSRDEYERQRQVKGYPPLNLKIGS